MGKRGPQQLPRAERFWAKVDRSGECWLWLGVVNEKRGGYGYFYDDDTRLRRAHRVAWEMLNGRISEEQYLLHECDTPRCVRPDHLRLGTQRENIGQMWQRRRAGHNKLNPEKVRYLRAEHARGHSYADLAKELGVTESCVDKADRRINWASVD